MPSENTNLCATLQTFWPSTGLRQPRKNLRNPKKWISGNNQDDNVHNMHPIVNNKSSSVSLDNCNNTCIRSVVNPWCTEERQKKENVNMDVVNSFIQSGDDVTNSSMANITTSMTCRAWQTEPKQGAPTACADAVRSCSDGILPSNVPLDPEEKKRQRRERQKAKKEIRKQEKAMIREEEVRKKRQAPKDQKVTVIDQSILERLQLRDAERTPSAAKSPLDSCSDFPSLGEVRASSVHRFQRNRRERSKDRRATHNEEGRKGSPREEGSSAADRQRERSVSKARLLQENATLMKGSEDLTKGRRPKRRDPIHFHLHEMLKVQETKSDCNQKQHKLPHRVEVQKYSGNMLDSDNPQRKRGKQREVPRPKKPSNLKQLILQDRAKRKEVNLQNALALTRKKTPVVEENTIHIEINENHVVMNEEECFEGIDLKESTLKCDLTKEQNTDLEGLVYTTAGEMSVCVEKISEITISEEASENPKEDVSVADEELLPMKRSVGSVTLQPKIHSRKFRDYCDHCITPDIMMYTTSLLEDIVRFHDRQFARSPLKATAKRRHVTGLKEVRRFLALRRIHLLVIAPDLEPSGGLTEIVAQLKESAIVNGVPYVFALGRRQLGYTLKKKVPVSCVGVLNYDGTEHNFRGLLTALEKGQELYLERTAKVVAPCSSLLSAENPQVCEEETVDDVNKKVVATLLAKLTETNCAAHSLLEAIERGGTEKLNHLDDNGSGSDDKRILDVEE